MKTGPSSCGDGDVRLVGGENERGQVEICYNGVWGTVCDYGWDQVDASVVCQQLGFDNQRAIPTSNSHIGAGVGTILFENVRCHSTLYQCVDLRLIGGLYNCYHTAGVICVGEDMMNISTEPVSATTLHVTTDSTGLGSSTIAIFGTVSALFIVIVIAVITTVLIVTIMVRKNKANRQV